MKGFPLFRLLNHKVLVSAICLFLFAFAPLFARTDSLQAFRDGEFERAIAISRGEIAGNPRNLESHVIISWSLMSLGRLEEALAFATAGSEINRYDVRIILMLGEIAFFQGRNPDAQRYFQEFIARAPDGPRKDRVYHLLGEVYMRMGRFRHADIALTTAVHRVPNNAAWWTRLAYARENAGDLIAAVAAYQQAIYLNSQLGDAQRGLERVRQALARL
ncbi:MAG: tetratricopeptide repeat protein [Treponema sp.]|jgi:predicted Zn-dependent protease|nr:tetratricopeptide repeat protein [Treponema sp.]